jgi:hypothetical protein
VTYEEARRQANEITAKQLEIIDDGLYEIHYTFSGSGQFNISHLLTEDMLDNEVEGIFGDPDDWEYEIRCRVCRKTVTVGHNCVQGDFDPEELLNEEREEEEPAPTLF